MKVALYGSTPMGYGNIETGYFMAQLKQKKTAKRKEKTEQKVKHKLSTMKGIWFAIFITWIFYTNGSIGKGNGSNL